MQDLATVRLRRDPETLRDKGIDVPAVLVSAAAEIEELAALHGFDGAVAKPCSTQAILTGAGATFAFSGEAIEILVSGRPSLDCSSDGLLYLLARGLG